MPTTTEALPVLGNDLSVFEGSTSSVVDNGGSLGGRTNGSLVIPPGETAVSVKWPTEDTLWEHALFGCGLPLNPIGSEVPLVQFLLAGSVVAQINVTGFTSMTFYLYTKQSGSLTLVGTTAALPTYPGLVNTLDFNIVAGAAGVGAIYSAGVQQFRVTGLNHTGFAGIDQIKKFSVDSSIFHDTESVWDEIFIRDRSTIGTFVYQDALDTNQGGNQWSGTVSDINEVPTSDVDFISSGTPGDVSTFYDSTLDFTGLSIVARSVTERFRVQGAGPAHDDLGLRIGASFFYSSDIAADAGFQVASKSWTQNPDGSVSWTPATVITSKPTVRSAA